MPRRRWTPAPLLWCEPRIGGAVWRAWLSCPQLSPGVFEDSDGNRLDGCCLYTSRDIMIDVRVAPSRYGEVWLHEVMHATAYRKHAQMYRRRGTFDSEELVIDALDAPLFATLSTFGLTIALPEGWQRLRAWAREQTRAEKRRKV